MNVSRRRQGLWLAAALVALVGAAGLLLGAILPVRVELQGGSSVAVVATPAAVSDPTQELESDQDALDAMARLATLCQRNLRPSSQVATEADPVAQANPAVGSIRVLAAVIESHRSLALLAHGDGQARWYAVGDPVREGTRNWTVKQINRRSVTLRDAAGAMDLPMPKWPGGEP